MPFNTFEYRREWRRQNKDKVAAQNRRAYNTQRNWRFRREYKCNIDLYEKMLKDQNERCLICNRHWTEFKNEFAIDHCHKTQKIRGLLCFTCNTKLAVIEDSIFVLKAKEYLGGISNAVSK